MKLIRFGEAGNEKPGVFLPDGSRLDLSQNFDDWNRDFFGSGGLEQLRNILKTDSSLPRIAEKVRWGAPVARPGALICIGLNYSDHARESGMPIPTEPIIFMKATNTIVGPNDDVFIPRRSVKTDWEVELGIVIGNEALYLPSEEEAAGCIAGYAIVHDVSEREFQLERGGQWTKGKSCPTFSPVGPWLLTSDEIPDVRNLAMHLSVNGVTRQSGNTTNMVFGPATVVHYLSQFMRLEPGDIIATGTPPGVGLGMKPPTYLVDGDVVELSIDMLGEQRQRFRQA
ncbi:MAG: fumarylacetoacetate hydrolase family protein [Candidatus Sumerlaeota bacterium]